MKPSHSVSGTTYSVMGVDVLVHETNCAAGLRQSVLGQPTLGKARTRAGCTAIKYLYVGVICLLVHVFVSLSCGVHLCVLAGHAQGPCQPSTSCPALGVSGTATPSGHQLQTCLEPCKCCAAHGWRSGDWQGVRPRHNCSHCDNPSFMQIPEKAFPSDQRKKNRKCKTSRLWKIYVAGET